MSEVVEKDKTEESLTSIVDGTTRVVGRWLIVAGLLVVLTLAHFVSPPHISWLHDFLFKVTYLPIVLAAVWFGKKGGLSTGLVTGVIYTVHINWQLAGHHQMEQTGFWLELVLYLVIGPVVGALADRERHSRRRLQTANRDLGESLAALREKTVALLAAEESLRQADRLKAVGELAAGVAHEVRNPLGGILGAAKILADPSTDETSRAEFTAVLSQETRRLDQAIRHLLDLAHPPRPATGVALLQQEIDFVGKLTAGARSKTGAIFDAGAVPEGMTVAMATDALRQVILNLTLNALAALPPESGTIVWSAQKDAGSVRIRICDNGRGVDARVRERLFQPFATTGGDGSTGLGLAIVSRLLHDVGGDIRLERTGPDGTVFAVDLPSGSQNANTDISPDA